MCFAVVRYPRSRPQVPQGQVTPREPQSTFLELYTKGASTTWPIRSFPPKLVLRSSYCYYSACSYLFLAFPISLIQVDWDWDWSALAVLSVVRPYLNTLTQRRVGRVTSLSHTSSICDPRRSRFIFCGPRAYRCEYNVNLDVFCACYS